MADGDQQAGAGTLPETFQQRGIAAPFTTRVLSFARYRRSHGAADVLVPGLGGGTEVYVIPFKALPTVFSMTVYDRAVHEKLAALHAVNPLAMRAVALEVAATGLAGPRPMRRARRWRGEQEVLRNKILFALIKTAVAQLGGEEAAAHAMDERTLMTPDGLVAARNALKGFASRAGVNAGEIIQRLEVWADLTVVVGPPTGTEVTGPLVRRIEHIEALAADLTTWLAPEPPDTAEMAQRTATAARAAAKEARAVQERLAGSANAMSEPLQTWDKARVQINRRVERIAYLLDGWQRILDMWEAAQRADRHQQRDVLETFAQHVPVLPVEAVGADPMWIELRQSQARWVHQAQNRLDSEIDDTTREKLGNFRKEMA